MFVILFNPNGSGVALESGFETGIWVRFVLGHHVGTALDH
jgi:hypothetical protein